MKVGIWQGSTTERVHIDDGQVPLCHAHTRSNAGEPGKTNAFWAWWTGSLREVDCRRCLLIRRRLLREEAELVEKRILGKAGIQVDIEERV